MKKQYLQPSVQMVEVDEFKLLSSSSESWDDELIRLKAKAEAEDTPGCLGAILMFVLATFSVGAGLFYCL